MNDRQGRGRRCGGRAESHARLLMDILLGEGEMEEHISGNERDKGGKDRGEGKSERNEKHMKHFPPAQP